ncbi:MAG TPA: hypothetical protein VIA29_00720 [Thermoanaerobaculia bacterium]
MAAEKILIADNDKGTRGDSAFTARGRGEEERQSGREPLHFLSPG